MEDGPNRRTTPRCPHFEREAKRHRFGDLRSAVRGSVGRPATTVRETGHNRRETGHNGELISVQSLLPTDAGSTRLGRWRAAFKPTTPP